MVTSKRNASSPGSSGSAKQKTETKKKKDSGRKYSPEASSYVEAEMKEMKSGELKSGGSDKEVHNPKQAIAIGLSEARRAGKKVPPAPRDRKAA
jgi:Family of unknown function (DUF6496)